LAVIDATSNRVGRVNEMTAREVTAVADELERIVTEARAHVADAKAGFEALAGTGSKGVASLVAEQSLSTQQYLDEVGVLIANQRSAAERAMSLSAKIVDLGEQISAVSFDARLLSLNASIESGRLGEHGAAFRVISSEMKRLTEAVDGTNKLVAEVAKEVCQALPEIESGGSKLHERSQRFSEETKAQLNLVDAEAAQLKARVDRALQGGDSRLRAILGASANALSHLQFQDPCAQSLRIIENDVLEMANRVEAAIAVSGAGEARVTEKGAAVVGTFKAATSYRSVNAGEVVALESKVAGIPDAGDVMLF
jgi:methyl-accepting chemotaxis protein